MCIRDRKNAVCAAAGDLFESGESAVAVCVCSDKDNEEKSFVFYNNRKIEFSTNAARRCEVKLFEGRERLFVTQGANSVLNDTFSQIITFEKDGSFNSVKLPTGDCARLTVGNGKVVSLNHETGRVRGDENIMVFLGGENGFNNEQKLLFPGYAAAVSYTHLDVYKRQPDNISHNNNSSSLCFAFTYTKAEKACQKCNAGSRFHG